MISNFDKMIKIKKYAAYYMHNSKNSKKNFQTKVELEKATH